jgi:hypothetical protein
VYQAPIVVVIMVAVGRVVVDGHRVAGGCGGGLQVVCDVTVVTKHFPTSLWKKFTNHFSFLCHIYVPTFNSVPAKMTTTSIVCYQGS